MTSMTWMRTLRQIVAAGVILLVALLWMTPRAMAETQSGGSMADMKRNRIFRGFPVSFRI